MAQQQRIHLPMQEMRVLSLAWGDLSERDLATHSTILAWEIPWAEETWVQSLGRKDPLEKEMATHSTILAWEIPRTKDSGGLQSSSVHLSSVTQSYLTLCDSMNCSMPGLPIHHHLPEFSQTHVHRVRDAIQPSHPLSSPSPPAPNPSQHQSLFQ